ncbi:hypothetical protein Hanom_Chr03g00205681 [Helianthus anomalus]
MRHSSDSWCDYVVVSDSLEGLAPAVMRKPKLEPKDAADIPPSNPEDPIELVLMLTFNLPRKFKRKSTEGAILLPLLRNLFLKLSSPIHTEPSSVVNEELPPSPSRAPVNGP